MTRHPEPRPVSTSSRASRFAMLRRLPVILAVLALALLLAPAVAQAKLPKRFIGISQNVGIGALDYQEMHKIKVKTVRISLNWPTVEKQKGQFVWPDSKIAALAENGITPLISVFGSPRWTGISYQGSPPVKGKAKTEWKKFLKHAIKRYGPKGRFWRRNPDIPKKPVTAWQIWNEPNLPKYFGQVKDGEVKQYKHTIKAYATLLKSSDKAIHKADKHATVVLAGLSGNPKKKKMAPPKFLKKFLKVRKVKKHFDAAALHPYAPNMKKYKKILHKTRKAMVKRGAKKKSLWLTEVGWGSGPPEHRLTKGRRGQAKLLKKSFKYTVKKRKKWNIDRLYWFNWRDVPQRGPRAICAFCPTAGLEEVNRDHKPSFKQFRKFSRKQGKRRHHRHHHHRHHHHHR